MVEDGDILCCDKFYCWMRIALLALTQEGPCVPAPTSAVLVSRLLVVSVFSCFSKK